MVETNGTAPPSISLTVGQQNMNPAAAGTDFVNQISDLTINGARMTYLYLLSHEYDDGEISAEIIDDYLHIHGEKRVQNSGTLYDFHTRVLIPRAVERIPLTKYNVASDCYKNAGAGGEYEVQEGFGWTNGVILDLLKTYQSDLHWSTSDEYAVSECECCRVPPIMPPQPQIADIMSQQLIMNNSNVPLVIVPQPTEPMLIHNAMSVASPVEPQAIFIQHVPTQQQIQE
ncbi:trehalase domain-containing protein [Ditylenchus destructor]|nr:trehalase domain-containing protein [Ditylenchus destructor]